ncbi:aminotransferase class III-fold pyridoxal phosphate-dependent enzyme [uncultured Desulfosarcina sp.]|uniref:aspartate aminotransferase family protein n=1 Tax=uncultured Desulfosarcina sp. TaxID=218289 RepID=UPI0029C61092|nr:aminotransferase class III-fold pyridoxal phosphate-dependent enzyme [uncultured Desulfosarcina sp.]
MTPNQTKFPAKSLLKSFGQRISQGQIRYLRAGHLDIFEGARKNTCFLESVSGKRFYDAFSAAGCFNVGRGNPEIIETLIREARRRDMGSAGMLSAAKIEFAVKLAKIAPGDLNRVILVGSGGDGIGCAIKLARGATGRQTIVSMNKAYHGHSGFSLSANGKAYYRQLFEPLMPEFRFIDFGDIQAARRVITPDIAAVILEPVQGEGGIHVADDAYLRKLRQRCDETGTLLIFDEIQTGFCRTGKFWASEHSGVVPDIMIAAKSISGGVFPNAAVVFREIDPLVNFVEKYPQFHPSFGGSDLGCTVSSRVIDYLFANRVWEHAAQQGSRFIAGLRNLREKHAPVIREVRGRGLMVGIEYKDEFMGVLMADCLAQQNIFAAYSGNAPQVMRFQLPLSVTAAEVDDLLSKIDAAIRTLKRYLVLLRPLTLFPVGRWLLNEKDMLIPLNLFLRRFGL